MLKREILQNRTYALLKEIMQNEDFKDFVLFGGTALALQIGHRKSIDLDFIKENEFSLNDIRNKLKKNYNFNELRQSENVLIGDIDGIKVDFVFEKNNLLDAKVEEDGIRLLSIKDICAMKLMSISDNGSRFKDYIDIATLSRYYSLNDMLSFFNKKYDIKSSIIPIRPLCDFSRIDKSEKLEMVDQTFNYEKCKERILEMAANPDKVF